MVFKKGVKEKPLPMRKMNSSEPSPKNLVTYYAIGAFYESNGQTQ
jgi:hypothetical protein